MTCRLVAAGEPNHSDSPRRFADPGGHPPTQGQEPPMKHLAKTKSPT